ncbi:MAG: hypothetical protein A2252_08695 [Elusimicrobia bacterium RIFOXYA2_FULL_39_19]|nr:MAG: hypothetical protein A2252_08695 [Elusimicrobia bacterium RIFOXYA2_FULL_39_19]
MSRKGAVTIKDIAKIAKVDFSTVSRALNNHPYIKADTKDKIFRIATKYNYVPNTAAMSLKNKNTQTLGLVLHTITNPFWSELLERIEIAMYRSKQEMVLLFSGQQEDREETYIEQLMNHKMDGAIITLMPTGDSDRFVKSLEGLKKNKFPFVLMFGDIGIECNCVSFNHYKGQYLLTEHLIKTGHRNICYARGSLLSIPNIQKIDGFKKALEANNIEARPEVIFPDNMIDISSIIDRVLGLNPRPTAIMAADDNMAMFYWRELASRGIRVPEDIAIVGFYDIAYLKLIKFPLTTIRIPADIMANDSVSLLIEQIKNPDMKYKKIVIEPELIVRESCGIKKVV